MNEELEYLNKKIFQLDKSVTMALEYYEEDPDYVLEEDTDYEEELDEDESDFNKSYQNSVKDLEQKILINSFQNLLI